MGKKAVKTESATPPQSSSEPILLCQVLSEEYASLRAGVEFSHEEHHETCLAGLRDLAHTERFSALCLSGGGIRSATFCLGIIQGLARLRLLEKLDYLSTVSGGGYIGSWLMAWIHRHRSGAAGVFQELRSRPMDPRAPEPLPIRHLRSYSNYLSPRPGFLSADTWTLVAIYLRNLLMVWLVLLPFLAALLILPRLVALLLSQEPLMPGKILLGLAFGLGTVANAYTALNQPSATAFVRPWLSELRKRIEGQTWFLILCLAPLIGAAFCFVLYAQWYGELEKVQNSWLTYGISGLVLFSGGWTAVLLLCRTWKWNLRWIRRFVLELGVVTVAGSILGVLAWRVARELTKHQALLDERFLAAFGVPLLLGASLLIAVLGVGFVRYWSTDDDREWWARLEAWVLIAIVIWALLSVLVIYVPACFFEAGACRGVPQRLFIALGGLSGLVTVFVAWSQKTPAMKDMERPRGVAALVRKAILALAAPLFGAFVIITLASLTTWLMLRSDARFGLALASHRDVILNYPLWGALGLMVLLFLFVALADLAIDINKFSLHSMYRNRLVRAYLGASNEGRKPNRFTGLDSTDNVEMNRMRRILLEREDLGDWQALKQKLMESDDDVAKFIRAQLTPTNEALLTNDPATAGTSENEIVNALLDELNARLEDSDLSATPPKPMPEAGLRDKALIERNRDELVRTFGDTQINVRRPRKPLHIVNLALNLVSGEELAWQERKAESFTISAHHCGSSQLDKGRGGYRSSSEFMKHPGVPVTLGTAAAISGAAASPNMGYHSSKSVAFLMTLLNARLGWWAGNPGTAGAKTFYKAGPRFAVRAIVGEALGRTNDRAPYVYLSDGGHFDNLGLYEMVLRRCRSIIVIDASADPNSSLEGLGNAIRKIRIDMGISIDLNQFLIYDRAKSTQKGTYCAVGSIKYALVDGGDNEGRLVYIKPAIYFKQEPRDIYNYAKVSDAFPHESTRDQWFSESQFESYRMLGDYIIQTISKQGKLVHDGDSQELEGGWEGFCGAVEDYLEGF